MLGLFWLSLSCASGLSCAAVWFSRLLDAICCPCVARSTPGFALLPRERCGLTRGSRSLTLRRHQIRRGRAGRGLRHCRGDGPVPQRAPLWREGARVHAHAEHRCVPLRCDLALLECCILDAAAAVACLSCPLPRAVLLLSTARRSVPAAVCSQRSASLCFAEFLANNVGVFFLVTTFALLLTFLLVDVDNTPSPAMRL